MAKRKSKELVEYPEQIDLTPSVQVTPPKHRKHIKHGWEIMGNFPAEISMKRVGGKIVREVVEEAKTLKIAGSDAKEEADKICALLNSKSYSVIRKTLNCTQLAADLMMKATQFHVVKNASDEETK